MVDIKLCVHVIESIFQSQTHKKLMFFEIIMIFTHLLHILIRFHCYWMVRSFVIFHILSSFWKSLVPFKNKSSW